MREVTRDINVGSEWGLAGGSSTVRRGDNPAFDGHVVAAGTDLWLGGTSSTGEDDAADHVEVAPESELHVEIPVFLFLH